MTSDCDNCDGTGEIDLLRSTVTCEACGGSGVVEGSDTAKLKDVRLHVGNSGEIDWFKGGLVTPDPTSLLTASPHQGHKGVSDDDLPMEVIAYPRSVKYGGGRGDFEVTLTLNMIERDPDGALEARAMCLVQVPRDADLPIENAFTGPHTFEAEIRRLGETGVVHFERDELHGQPLTGGALWRPTSVGSGEKIVQSLTDASEVSDDE